MTTEMTQTRRRKPALLRAIKLDELSLVDRPANPHARITLFKRADDKEHDDMQRRETNEPLAFDSFEAAVAHLRKLHGCTGTQAMQKAARHHPDLLAAYLEEGAQRVAKAERYARRRGSPPEAVQQWDLLVDAIAEEKRVPRRRAMEIARRRHPDKFRAYRMA